MAQHFIPRPDWSIRSIGLCTNVPGVTSICCVNILIILCFIMIFLKFIAIFCDYRQVGCDTELSTYSVIAGLWASMYSLG